MDPTTLIPKNWSWLIEISIGIFVIFLLSLGIKKVVSIIRKHTEKREKGWQRRIHKIIHVPLQVAVWGFGIAYVLDVLFTHFGLEDVTKFIRPLKGAFIVACLGWLSQRWVREAFRHFAKRSEQLGVATGTIYALNKLSSFLIFILTLLIIFQIFGLDVGPILAFGGIGVAGVAFAAKDMIANFFGGAMLHFTRIFSIGDAIVISSKDFRGIVKEIGWYTTMAEDYYRRPVYFPNALFTTTDIINESRRTHRRIRETIAIRYDDMPNLEKILQELNEKVAAHPQVDPSDSFSITFSKFGTSGLEIFLYVLVNRMSYIKFLTTQQEVFFIVQEVVSKYGAEFCYPTTIVHLNQMPLKP